MNILFNLPAYIPYQMAGAETMAHRMARFLVQKGHKVTVLQKGETTRVDGVNIQKWERKPDWKQENIQEFKEADLVFTHLGQTADTFNKARLHAKKIVHIAHNSYNYQTVRCRVANNYVVYNSDWVCNALGYEHKGFILRPPVDYREYEKVNTAKAKYVTLINLNENKGGHILIELAKRMPEVQFLGVEGGYYHQIKDTTLPNLTYRPQTTDIRKVLKDTKVLIIPSEYESWGQVGIEAAACGIPVVASPTTGLKASLGDGALYADRNNIEQWVEAIGGLLALPTLYEKVGKNLKARAIELDPIPDLEKFNQWVTRIGRDRYKE